jgi:hypothetical protein
MRAIAAFVMRGRWQAVLATAGLAVASLVLMPLSWPLGYLSGGAVGLVTLQQGPREGLLNVVGATLLIGGLGLVLNGQPMLGASFALTLWLPMWLLAGILALYRSLSLAMLANLALGMALILGAWLVLDDPAVWWQRHFSEVVIPALEQAGMKLPSETELQPALQATSRLMTGILSASLVLGLAISLLIARWWQAELGRPGAFGEEFRRLRLGSLTAGLAVLLVVGLSFIGGKAAALGANLLLVFMVIFMLQGLALAHAAVHQAGANKAWLIVLYVLLAFSLPWGMLVIAVLGWLDNWLNFRARLRRHRD